MNNFESSFIQFCILYGFIIWFVKFISVIAMRLKLQYNAFVLPVYLSIVGLFIIHHFFELKISLFDIGNGETEFHSGQFYIPPKRYLFSDECKIVFSNEYIRTH